jgi:glycosyltransferase involved in cell wall biosynthesis
MRRLSNDTPFLLDATRLIWRRWKGLHPTGIDRVCLAYMRHFGGRAQAVVQHKFFRRILDRRASQRLFELLDGSSADFRRKLPAGLLRHLDGLNENGSGRLYLNIGHTGLDSPGFRDWVSRSGVRPIYFVHDLIPITHPQYCRAGEGEKHRKRMRTVLTTATGVIGNSRATLDELACFGHGEQLHMPPSLSAWLGSDGLLPAKRRQVSEHPSFVVLGTIEARKNHLLLLKIWSRMVDRLGDRAPHLTIIGQRGWEAQQVFDLLDRGDRLEGHVTELNRCSDDELAQQLVSARALLFPSRAEGYGLPLIEALAAGVPVIASDLPALREIGGDIPTYLDPIDENAWEEAILDYAQMDGGGRSGQIGRMNGFRAPDWNSHFDRVETWLGSLA